MPPRSAKFDPERMILEFPAYPAYTGFLEYHLPALGIRFGVQQSGVMIKKPDEFFGIDGSFSWGATSLTEAQIRSYCRILKQNGILWNRDRLSWNSIQPAEGKFVYDGQFALYRKIAVEEGIKTIRVSHRQN